jgi:hypothetical protein
LKSDIGTSFTFILVLLYLNSYFHSVWHKNTPVNKNKIIATLNISSKISIAAELIDLTDLNFSNMDQGTIYFVNGIINFITVNYMISFLNKIYKF